MGTRQEAKALLLRMIVARSVHWYVILMMHLELFVSIGVLDSIMNRRNNSMIR